MNDLEYFNQRPRFTEEETREILLKPSPRIMHLCDNQDGTFSILMHIVCEWCDFCDEQGDCRGNFNSIPVVAKLNVYENQFTEI